MIIVNWCPIWSHVLNYRKNPQWKTSSLCSVNGRRKGGPYPDEAITVLIKPKLPRCKLTHLTWLKKNSPPPNTNFCGLFAYIFNLLNFIKLRNERVQDKIFKNFYRKYLKLLSKHFAENGKEKLSPNDSSFLSNL